MTASKKRYLRAISAASLGRQFTKQFYFLNCDKPLYTHSTWAVARRHVFGHSVPSHCLEARMCANFGNSNQIKSNFIVVQYIHIVLTKMIPVIRKCSHILCYNVYCTCIVVATFNSVCFYVFLYLWHILLTVKNCDTVAHWWAGMVEVNKWIWIWINKYVFVLSHRLVCLFLINYVWYN
jgi:hypothetical protein